MMTWTPEQWITTVSGIVGSCYAIRFMYILVISMFGFERLPYEIHVTLTQENNNG
jgi:hypothetical protein